MLLSLLTKNRNMKVLLSFAILVAGLSACAQTDSEQEQKKDTVSKTELSNAKVAYFASGCFWCVEGVYESVEGVLEVESGYAGGSIENPTYEEVCTGRTGHAETVKVYYDSSIISYPQLLEVFFDSHDPTTLNRQGPDSGSQYRSAVFYQDKAEQKAAEAYIAKLKQGLYAASKITTEVSPLTEFYKAEDYHQDYERLHPESGYVKGVSVPRLNKFKAKHPELLKKD